VEYFGEDFLETILNDNLSYFVVKIKYKLPDYLETSQGKNEIQKMESKYLQIFFELKTLKTSFSSFQLVFKVFKNLRKLRFFVRNYFLIWVHDSENGRFIFSRMKKKLVDKKIRKHKKTSLSFFHFRIFNNYIRNFNLFFTKSQK